MKPLKLKYSDSVEFYINKKYGALTPFLFGNLK